MRCIRCGTCCQETEMLLSTEDITRLEKEGYSKTFFVCFDKEGYAILRNRQGHCVFYNPEKMRCNVYAVRPLGCRIYPVIYDEDHGIVADTICPVHGTVTAQEKKQKGKKVVTLLKRIDNEAQHRST